MDLKWKLPLHADDQGIYILDADGNMVVEMRGWGFLTGSGGKFLDPDDAIVIQKARAEFIVNAVNATEPHP